MIILLKLPDYSPEKGLFTEWETGFSVSTSGTENCFILSANKAGLASLATHIMALAQDHIPTGFHIHYDELNSLEDGSIELVIQKTD